VAVRRLAAREHGDPAKEGLGRLLLRTVREMRRTFDRSLEGLGITGPQAEILFRCAQSGGLTPKELAQLLITDNAGVTRLVDRLEAKGLVTRTASAHDGRSVTLRLTPAGRMLVPRVRRVAEAQKHRIFEGLTIADEQHLGELLQRVLRNVGGPS
jgi:DNA-binding MarR family transcriptional regulator